MTHASYVSFLVLAASGTAMAAMPSPAAWWDFAPSGDNDTHYLVEDISGNGFDAVVLEPSLVSRSTDASDGAALAFSPGKASAETRELVAASLPEPSVGDPFTLSAWVRTDGLGSVIPILSRTTDAEGWSDGFVLFLDGNGIPGFAVGPGADHAALADADLALRPGDWRHLALVSDGTGTTTLFLDGAEVASVPFAALPADTPLAFGPVTESGESVFTGFLADVRLYDCALSTEMIAELGSPSGTKGGAIVFNQTAKEKSSASASAPPPSSAPAPSRSSAPLAPVREPPPVLRVWTRMD